MGFISAFSDEYVHIQNQTRAIETINTTKARLRATRQSLDNDLLAALTYADPDLTAQGVAKYRQQLAAQVRAKHKPVVDGLTAQITGSAQQLAAAAEKLRPVVNWSDPASIQRAQAKWDQSRMRLDAGIRLEDVTANADLDTLAALAEWAPAWIDTQTRSTRPVGLSGGLDPVPEPSYAYLRALIDARAAQLLGEKAATAFTAAKDAEAIAAYAQPLLAHLQATIEGTPSSSSALEAALGAHYAEQQTRGPQHPPDGSNSA